MRYTALHRVTGTPPGDLTNELLDLAVAEGAAEASDLDWKSALPPAEAIVKSDFPKDIAAMANAGGGLIVYGVTESQKAATGRVDVGPLTENHERTLRNAAVTSVSPPILNLRFDTLSSGEASRAIVVEVPTSVDGPHLVYRNDHFGAPIRNDADTRWMREREIEAAYRQRFAHRRVSEEDLTLLYDDAVGSVGSVQDAWLVGVARPRIRTGRAPADVDAARSILASASAFARSMVASSASGTLTCDTMNLSNPRVGLRRWTAHQHPLGPEQFQTGTASIHHDGSITHAVRAGGGRSSDGTPNHGGCVHSTRIETFTVALLGLARAAASYYGNTVYTVRAGLVGDVPPIRLVTPAVGGGDYEPPVPALTRFRPVDVEIRADLPEPAYLEQVRDFALDLVNQGGVENLHVLRRADHRDPPSDG